MRRALEGLATKRDSGQHPGLLLHRYLNHPDRPDRKEDEPAEKRALFNAVCEAANDNGLRTLYTAAFDRWAAALPPITEAATLVTAGRLIVGLGAETVLETGLRLHHTYGLPVIPGSALKGLAAHYCHEVWGQSAVGDSAPPESQRFRRDHAEEKFRYHRLLFGTHEDAGAIVFHDAWLTPNSPDPLAPDVMTPHHPKWLDGSAAPTDFDSPVPVSFLSVVGTFKVAVSWNSPAEHAGAKNWIELALTLLKEALWEWGVGGKTSSGYGRLVDPTATQASSSGSAASPVTARPAPPRLPKVKDRVAAVLLPEKTKKGGWRARLKDGTHAGPIQNSADVPADKNAGDEVPLEVASVNPTGIAFKWPK